MSALSQKHVAYILLTGIAIIAVLAGLLVWSLQRNATVEEPRHSIPVGSATSLFEKKEMTVKGTIYTYYLYSPKSQSSDKSYPLTLVMHGSPGKAYAAEYLTGDFIQKRYPSYVLVPVLAKGRHWARHGEEHFGRLKKEYALNDMVTIIKNLQKQKSIDPNRIYAIGCSAGGRGAFGAARYHPDVFAASIAISGTWSPDDARHMLRTPLWVMHGTHDSIFPVETVGQLVNNIEELDGNVKYTEYTDMAHNCPAAYLYKRQVWSWMFFQKLNND